MATGIRPPTMVSGRDEFLAHLDSPLFWGPQGTMTPRPTIRRSLKSSIATLILSSA